VLEDRDAAVAEERSSRKEPLTDADAEALLAAVETVIVARGKNVTLMTADEASLDDLKGPTGNYRAPIVRKGATLLVGFHADALSELIA
jgi:hypothetical protein